MAANHAHTVAPETALAIKNANPPPLPKSDGAVAAAPSAPFFASGRRSGPSRVPIGPAALLGSALG